jgi:D-3-phosphoglycerate dehydrogenase
MDDVFKNADFITLHVPLLDQTRHMVNESRLKSMRRTAYIINASRGEVIDEKALLKALRERWIAGAGLDVFEVEPPTLKELVQLGNCICTPHIGGQTEEAQVEASTSLAQKIIDTLKGSS